MRRRLKLHRIRLLKRARDFWPRLVGKPYPTRAEYSSLLAARSGLTVVARLPYGRRFDRQLSWLLRLPPRFLSNRVALPKHRVPGGLRAQLKYWLWRRHSPTEAAWTALLIAVDIILVSLAVGVIFNISTPPAESHFKWASPDLVAIAGYSGAIFGFLQAVLVFVAQIRSQQDTSMLPLTTMWARKYHAFEILALSAGIAISNLAVALLDPFLASIGDPVPWSTMLYAPMLAMNLILLPAMTALSLWMLASIIADAGDTDMRAIKPVIRAAMATAAREDAQLVGSANLFVSEMQSAGMKYSPFAHANAGRSKGVDRSLDIGSVGVLLDVDCVALQRITRICEATEGLSIEFAVLPGQRWSMSQGAVAKFESEAEGKIDIEEPLARLQRAFQRVLVLDTRGST